MLLLLLLLLCRGFETCSIMLEGEMQHKDSAGNAVSEQQT
jgi:redox-sensitive bicupin YhaK (pirin superfamily)